MKGMSHLKRPYTFDILRRERLIKYIQILVEFFVQFLALFSGLFLVSVGMRVDLHVHSPRIVEEHFSKDRPHIFRSDFVISFNSLIA